MLIKTDIKKPTISDIFYKLIEYSIIYCDNRIFNFRFDEFDQPLNSFKGVLIEFRIYRILERPRH